METPKQSYIKYSNNYFNNSNELSPATTSIELFSKKQRFTPINNKENEFSSIDIEYQCSICGALFGLEKTKAAPKRLPCGHNFCSECIFSLCLHREYYLLDTINCLKCNVSCEARLAIKAPINYELCNLIKKNCSSPSIVTVIQANNKTNNSNKKIISKCRQKKVRLKSVNSNKKLLNNNYASLIHDNQLQKSQNCFDNQTKNNKILNKDKMTTNFSKNKCDNIISSNEINSLSLRQNQFNNEILKISKKFDKIIARTLKFTAQRKSECKTDDFNNFFIPLINFNEIISIFEKSKKILLNEIQIEQHKELKKAQRIAFIRRFEKLYTCLTQKIDTKYFQICLFSLNKSDDQYIVSSLLSICVYIETILSISTLLFTESHIIVMSSLQRQTFFALEKSLKEIQFICESFNECESKIFLTLQNCAVHLTSFLNENCTSEIIIFSDASFYKIFQLLKHLLMFENYLQIKIKKINLWKTVQTAYSELLRIASLHWQSSNLNRIEIVANITHMCVLFADICDTATVLVCMIEVARARASIDNQFCNNNNEITKINNSEKLINNNLIQNQHEQALSYFKQIDENLIECRRIQKLSDLRLRTKMIKKNSTSIVTPTSTTEQSNKKSFNNELFLTQDISSTHLSNKKNQKLHFLYRLFRLKRQK